VTRLVGAALVVLVAAGCSAHSASDPAAAPYLEGPTEACLRADGAAIRPLHPTTPAFRMLGDLAQRRSFEVRLDGAVVGVAFAKDVAGAQLLVDLLTLPNVRYEADDHGNVVVLHRSAEAETAANVASCLRG
jgi:hypothetical protein